MGGGEPPLGGFFSCSQFDGRVNVVSFKHSLRKRAALRFFGTVWDANSIVAVATVERPWVLAIFHGMPFLSAVFTPLGIAARSLTMTETAAFKALRYKEMFLDGAQKPFDSNVTVSQNLFPLFER